MSRIAIVVALAVVVSPGRSSGETTDLVDGTTPRLMVVGVVIPDRGISLAAIEDRATMRTQFYRVGDSVNGGVVMTIAPDRVTIAFGDELTLLRLAGAATPLESRADRARDQRSSDRPVADAPRRLDGPSSLYGQIGAIRPVFRGPRAARKDRDETGGATGGGPSASVGGAAAAAVGVGANTTAVQFIGVQHGGSEQLGEQFSAQSLRDLLISVTHTNLSASTQRIELSTPEGGLYQKFSGDATPASQVRVPIGGTWITQHGLFGTWTVRVYLDRQGLPAASGAFILSQ